jgi:hypothetical protein
MWDGTEKNKPVIWVWCEEEIFLKKGLDTMRRRQPVRQITSTKAAPAGLRSPYNIFRTPRAALWV